MLVAAEPERQVGDLHVLANGLFRKVRAPRIALAVMPVHLVCPAHLATVVTDASGIRMLDRFAPRAGLDHCVRRSSASSNWSLATAIAGAVDRVHFGKRHATTHRGVANHSDDFLRRHICIGVNRCGGSQQQVRLQLHSEKDLVPAVVTMR